MIFIFKKGQLCNDCQIEYVMRLSWEQYSHHCVMVSHILSPLSFDAVIKPTNEPENHLWL